MTQAVKVFISYSHDSKEHQQWVLELSNQLRTGGIDCEIDQYDPAPDQGWPVWMLQNLQDANYVLLICTETYRRRFEQREAAGRGLGVTWEGMLMQNQLYRNGSRSHKFIPIIRQSSDEIHIPEPVYQFSRYDFSKALAYENLYRHLRGELGAEKPALGQPHFQRVIESDDLPTVEGKLFGRKEELALLNWALSGKTPSPHPLSLTGRGTLAGSTADHPLALRERGLGGEGVRPHIVQFIASGGTGKTKLIRHWLDENRERIEALIAWSFYSQGSSEDKQISATPFFMQALKSLGSDKSVSDFNTEEEKGEYVANLLREKRCLLVLDGLEPLQQVGRGMRGELKDRAIRKMLRCLVGDHSSLCIITTRLEVHELKGRKRVVSHDLQNLQAEDGVALLHSFGVSGRDADMLAAVHEYGRHALALHLLGNALATYLDGDVRKRDTLTELIGDYDDVERHAFKVMQAYERWLEGTPELKLLYLLGLFDHPVEQEVLEVLWGAEIAGLTAGVPKKAWLVAQRDLISRYRMMAETPSPQPLSLKGRGAKANIFDCHPLIREYFGRQLKENEGEVWRQAHTVLYEYYKGLPEKLWGKYLPDTLEEMQPLFRAVMHGCAAGLHHAVNNDLYWPRIKKKEKQYILYKLGAYSDDLSSLSNFYISPWHKIQNSLRPALKAFISSYAGYNLRAVGRLDEAIIPTSEAVKKFSDLNVSKEVAINTNNLSLINLTLGKVNFSLKLCLDGYKHSINSEDKNLIIDSQTIFAHILNIAGNIKASAYVFDQAQKNHQEAYDVDFPMSSLSGIRYCFFHLYNEEYGALLRKSSFCMLMANKNNNILETFLSALLLDFAVYKIGISEAQSELFNISLAGLRQARFLEHLPFGLLLFSSYKRDIGKFISCYSSLQEIYEIAEPSGMRLHLTDYHLEMARLILAIEADPNLYPEATPNREQRTLPPELADPDEPGILTLEGHIHEAERLINETGYHRRDAELAELKQALEQP